MSGAEALGLACNIFTVISVAHETINLCKSVYRGEMPGEELHQSAKLLEATSKDVQSQNDSLQQKPRTASQKRLHDIAAKCNIAARGLKEETEHLSKHHKKGDLVAMSKVAAKSQWRKFRLEKLERSMAECRRELDTQLLDRICSQAHATALQQKSDFTNLDHKIQQLIAGIATGQVETSKLVSKASQEIRDQVNKGLDIVGKDLKLHIYNSVDRAQSSAQKHTDDALAKATKRILSDNQAMDNRRTSHNNRDQLLSSLKFPRMNERRNTLTDPEEDTYRWIFNIVGHYDDESETMGSSNDLDSQSSWGYSYNSDSTYDSMLEDCEPILDDFVDWLRSDAKSYWISGKAGSGKSTLIKSIASAPESLAALNVWAEDIVTISYYFWKAGSLMQRSLRGLYCDLMHQLLTLRPSCLDELAAKYPTSSGASPREHTDWSTTSLRHELMTILKTYPCNICIFVDGLDEVCDEDGSTVVLNFIMSLVLLQNIKLCVSSRPEPAFQKAFGQWPQLRMETLTRKDMMMFSCRNLASIAPWPIEQLESLLQDLVEKSQGVFLWVRLAVRNLQSGLVMDDKLEDLEKRLQDLPGELEHLYWDMWQRSNKGSSVHREFSSSIIELLIQFQQFDSSHDGENIYISIPSCSFTLALASQPDLLQENSNLSTIMDQILNEEFWQSFETHVGNRCAGIVEFSRSEDHYLWYDPVRFIHRSAYDFFTETENGQLIRSYCPRHKQSHHVLCAAVLLEVCKLPDSLHNRIETGVHYTKLGLRGSDHLYSSLRLLRESNKLGLAQQVVIVFKRHYRDLQRSPRGLRADFLSHALGFLEELVISALTEAATTERGIEATMVLRHVLYNGNVSLDLVQRLLDLGAGFAEIGTKDDIPFFYDRHHRSALAAFFVRSAMRSYEPSELLFILQQHDLPLSQKTHFAVIYRENENDPVYIAEARSPGLLPDGWQQVLWLVVNLAHLLQITVDALHNEELSNLAAVHLRKHRPVAECIAVTVPSRSLDLGNDVNELAYYVPEQRTSDQVVDALRTCINLGPLEEQKQKDMFPGATLEEEFLRVTAESRWIVVTVEVFQDYILSHLDALVQTALPLLLHEARGFDGQLTHI